MTIPPGSDRHPHRGPRRAPGEAAASSIAGSPNAGSPSATRAGAESSSAAEADQGVVLAPAPTDGPIAARLLDDYFTFRSRGFTTHAGGYRVAVPDPAQFVPPRGVFLVVWEVAEGRTTGSADAAPAGGTAVGCGGVRRIDDHGGVATFEVKHLWIAEPARGRGWSRLLLGELEQYARRFGAQRLVLDTNASLTAAQHLYRTSGFAEIAPYNTNPNATHWFAKPLGPC